MADTPCFATSTRPSNLMALAVSCSIPRLFISHSGRLLSQGLGIGPCSPLLPHDGGKKKYTHIIFQTGLTSLA